MISNAEEDFTSTIQGHVEAHEGGGGIQGEWEWLSSVI